VVTIPTWEGKGGEFESSSSQEGWGRNDLTLGVGFHSHTLQKGKAKI